MKRRLVDAAKAAVEANKGVRGVSLRGIAAQAGCSHVNAYHYADGLAGLLWEAYGEALDEFAKACLERAGKPRRGDNFGSALARAMAAFALEREGLYRLLWFEDLGGAPRGQALEAVVRAKSSFDAAAFAAFRRDGFEADDGVLAGRQAMLFAYLQGELALLINGRSGPDRQAAAKPLVERARRLWGLLLTRDARGG